MKRIVFTDDDPNYCGYCKCSPCQCDGQGNTEGGRPCGYCHQYPCVCDGLGNESEDGEKEHE